MPSVFQLWGELRADTNSFEQQMLRAESRLKATDNAIERTAKSARDLGQTSAVTARGFEKLNEKVAQTRTKLLESAAAYQRGDISAKRFAGSLASVDTAAGRVSSKLADANAKLADFANRASRLPATLQTAGAGLRNVGTSLTAGITAPLVAAGYAFVQSATSLDALRNRLTAATGTTAKANAKFEELRQLAQANAGVFTASAVEMYSFLKPMQMSDAVINKMITGLGRLKLANEEMDTKRMAINIGQLFSGKFEMDQLKEGYTNFGRFGEILQKAFDLSGNDLDTVQKEMQDKLAKGLTREGLFKGIADALNNDPSLALLEDTIGTRWAKMVERLAVAFEPLGRAMVNVFEPIANAIAPVIERMSQAFTALSPTMQGVVLAFVGFAAALGPVLIAIGAVVSAIGSIAGAVAAIGGLAPVVAIIAAVGAGIAQLALAAGVLYAAWQTNFGGIRDLVTEVAGFISEQWSQAMTEISSLSSTVVSEVANFWETNGADIIAAVQKISNGIKQAWQGVAEFWRENGDNIREITSAVWEAVSGIVIGAVRAIGNVIKIVAAVINGDWSKAWDGLKSIVGVALDATIALISAGTRITLALIKGVFNAIWALGSWVHAQATKLGEYVGQGIVAGIQKWADDAISTAKSLANGVIAAAQGALWINSPSRKFIEIGEGVGEGFVMGIEAMKPQTQAAMKSVLDLTQFKGAGNKAGVDLAKSLTDEVRRQGVETKLGNVLLDLQEKEYAKLDSRLKSYIITKATEIDKYKAVQEYLSKGNDEIASLVDMLPKLDKTPAEELADAMNSAAIQFALANEKAGSFQATLNNIVLSTARLNAATLGDIAGGDGRVNVGGTMLGNGSSKNRQTLETLPPPPIQPWQNFWDTLQQRMRQFRSELPSFKQALGENLVSSIEGLANTFGNMFASFDGTMKSLWSSLIQGLRQTVSQIIGELMRLAAMKLITSLFGSLAGGLGGAAQSGFGNATSALGMLRFADGGFVSGGGTSTSDSIPARLSNGEFVMSAKAVRNWGRSFFENLNAGFPSPLAMAGGGMVSSFGGSSSVFNNQRTSTNNFHINVQGGGNPQQTGKQIAREAMNAMRREEMRNS